MWGDKSSEKFNRFPNFVVTIYGVAAQKIETKLNYVTKEEGTQNAYSLKLLKMN